MATLELWGGPECTVNRVGDLFRDQLHESGHHERASDLNLFGELGLSAVRYPVLWERVAPREPGRYDWSWSDQRMTQLQALGLRPIVGLVHHGSGPAYTDLLSDDFAPGLARYADSVACRYPWVLEWTPINEPLTTARFSALYGHWYPHHRDERSFWVALLNQIDGIRLAMHAIRQVIPGAKLLQTEDLGRTYATAVVRDQAAFDNVRRWMSWDLLCGKVIAGHPFWNRLCDLGLAHRLRAIAAAPCPPDTIGVNHYLTSDRFLDHRTRLYPSRTHGGSSGKPYADTEAIRVLAPAPSGLAGALREVWDRYRIPIAVTETHNGCTREEQARWLVQSWSTAKAAIAEGVEVKAVTAWSLLGSFGWNTLLTQRGSYEAGVYDVASGTPRPTALVDVMKRLASGSPLPSFMKSSGWWRRPIRFQHRPVARPASSKVHQSDAMRTEAGRPLLFVGLSGPARRVFASSCRQRGLLFSETENTLNLSAHCDTVEPWAILHGGSAIHIEVARVCAKLNIAIRVCNGDPFPCEVDQLLDELIDAASETAAEAA